MTSKPGDSPLAGEMDRFEIHTWRAATGPRLGGPVDGQNPVSPKKPWHPDLPAHTNPKKKALFDQGCKPLSLYFWVEAILAPFSAQNLRPPATESIQRCLGYCSAVWVGSIFEERGVAGLRICALSE